jgi:hypothetical protein
VLCKRWVRDGRVGVDRRVADDESGGWLVMERNVLLVEVLCERWVGERRVGDDERGGW